MKLGSNRLVLMILRISFLIAACSKEDNIPEPTVDRSFDLTITSATDLLMLGVYGV